MDKVSKIINELKDYSNLVAIYLFGSYAKGEEKPISDIDIAVILKNPSKEDEAEVGSLYSSKIDLVLFHRLPIYIQYEVFKYGKELYVKDEECLFELKLKTMKKYLEYSRMYNSIKREVLNE